MQFTPLQIKEKLLRALDDDNNVVDADAVLEVISILEKYPITRDALEQTRIGKHMNELRKKTTNEQLAKRAKKLVRNWQRLVSSEPEGRGAANGERVVTPTQHPCVVALQRGGNGSTHPSGISSPALSHSGKNSPLPGRRCMSPAMAGGKPLTPQMAARTPKCSSPALVAGKPATPTLHASRLSPGLKHSPSTGKPSTPSLQSSRQSPGQGSSSSQVGSGRSTTPNQTSRPPSGASPVLSNNSRSNSPAHKLASVDASPRLNPRNTSSPKSHSPKLDHTSASLGGRPSTPSGRPYTHKSSSRPATPNNNEDSNLSCPITPISGGHTEHEKNNSNSRIKSKAKLESDSGSVSDWKRDSSQPFASKSNHSPQVSNSSDKGSRKDQSDTSKTNVANRKRTRNQSPDTVPQKQPKTDNSCLSKQKREATINGVVGSHKNRKKDKGDPNRSNSATSISYSKGIKELSPVSPSDKTEAASYHIDKRQVNSKTEMTPKAQKTSKVKTTEELIAELQKRTGYGNDIMSKIKSNQIEKEVDAPCSVLPPGVKPRKKRGSMSSENLALLDQSSSPVLLSQTKNEMMEKFLESSVSHSGSDRLSPYKDDSLSKWESQMDSTNSFEEAHNGSVGNSASVNRGKPNALNSTSEVKTEAAVAAKLLSLEEIFRLLPPLDADSVDWEADDYSLGEPVAGTESDVERLHTENWENVNGCFDVNGQWHDWSQTLSRATCDSDLLHILPYVNIDD